MASPYPMLHSVRAEVFVYNTRDDTRDGRSSSEGDEDFLGFVNSSSRYITCSCTCCSLPTRRWAASYCWREVRSCRGKPSPNFCLSLPIPTLSLPPDAPPPASHQPNRPHPAYPNKDSHRDRDRGERPPIVEKPAATIAMEGAHVNTHGEKTGPALAGTEGKEVKVVRLLTRGTKLEP